MALFLPYSQDNFQILLFIYHFPTFSFDKNTDDVQTCYKDFNLASFPQQTLETAHCLLRVNLRKNGHMPQHFIPFKSRLLGH